MFPNNFLWGGAVPPISVRGHLMSTGRACPSRVDRIL